MSLDVLCNVTLFRGRWIGLVREDGLLWAGDRGGRYRAVFASPFEWVAPLYNGRPIKDSSGMIVYERIKSDYSWNGR